LPFCLLPFAFCLGLAAAPACGQSYPAKQIRVIVPLVPGGNLDLSTRAVLQQMGDGLGQRILVENRPGTSSLVGTQYVAKAAPDGYTLLAMANTFATVPLFVANPGYDPLKDFTGISVHTLVAQLLVVNPSLPARTVKELVALARAKPGDVTFASAGAGGIGYTAAVQFNSMAGVKMLHVPYKGNAQAILDVMGGQVMMMFDQVSTSTSPPARARHSCPSCRPFTRRGYRATKASLSMGWWHRRERRVRPLSACTRSWSRRCAIPI
jgi:tripartite-type tricarboxylate transporter receptor subunit TctC